MDDPLVPSEYGAPARWGIIILSFSMFTFMGVTIVLTAVTGKADWIVAAIALLLMVISTIILGQWIRSGQLEESKHTYLAALQVVAIMLLCGAILSNVYAGSTYSVTGVVSGANAGTLDKTVGSIKVNGNEIPLPQSTKCVPLTLLENLKSGASYSITMGTQPGQAQCSVSARGTIEKKNVNTVSVTCSMVFSVGGSVGGILSGYSPLVLTLKVDGAAVGPPESIAGDGKFYFKTAKIPNACASGKGKTFIVEVTTQPTSADGKTQLICSAPAMSAAVPEDCKAPVDYDKLAFNCRQGPSTLNTTNSTV